MSASDGIETGSVRGVRFLYLRLRTNIVAYLGLFRRRPRALLPTRSRTLPLIAASVIVAIAVAMLLLDGWSVGLVQRLSPGVTAFFDDVTDYGKSGWFLVPIGIMLVLAAVLCTPSLPVMSQRVLAAVAVRLGFLFTAIAVPGLIFTVVKRLIGRARPHISH
jgi:hypothetical protein